MLKEIVQIWKDGTVMHQAVANLARMVTDAEYVLTHAWEACSGRAVVAGIEAPLKERDKAVNAGERLVRRAVVEHLSLNPGQDVSGCLALLIMAKDIERVGDQARNVLGIVSAVGGPIPHFRFFPSLDAAQGDIREMLPLLRRAIVESSDQLAHDVLNRYQGIKTRLKSLRKELFTVTMDSREAVATALLMRYFTRANAHLGNAASGIVFPVENIDFVSRGLREEEKDR